MVAWLLEILIGQSTAMIMLRGICNSHYRNELPVSHFHGFGKNITWHTTTLPCQKHKTMNPTSMFSNSRMCKLVIYFVKKRRKLLTHFLTPYFFQNQNKLTTFPNWRKINFQYNSKKTEAPLYAAFIYFFLSATLYRLFGQTWQNNFRI